MKYALSSSRSQRGTVLLFSLIILVVMLISSVALVRSFDISLNTAGNLAFKRDLAQQSEQAAQTILARFRPGGALVTRSVRASTDPAFNYSATVLPSNPQGIPEALLDTSLPAIVGSIVNADTKINLHYVIDRLCTDAVADDASNVTEVCTLADSTVLPGGSSSDWQRAERGSGVAAGGTGAGIGGAVVQPVVYRLSIRADGPRGTQSFFQTTFSCCDS